MEENQQHDRLHIFVNRRRFDESDGVKHRMTGVEIVALVGIPRDNAVVRFDTGPDHREIGMDEVVEIKNGQHFLVTRRIVEGGHA